MMDMPPKQCIEQPAYSLAEMDRMRRAIRNILTEPLVPYKEEERFREIEARLLTEMAVGTRAEELESYDRELALDRPIIYACQMPDGSTTQILTTRREVQENSPPCPAPKGE